MSTLIGVLNKALVNVEAVGGGPNGGVTADEIWDKLGSMFDLEKLDALVSQVSLSSDGLANLKKLGWTKGSREREKSRARDRELGEQLVLNSWPPAGVT
jgi:hypothetical protein